MDVAVAAAVAVALAALAAFWSFGALTPELWEDAAIAAGLRPPCGPNAGVWHGLARGLFAWVGLARGLEVIRWAGPCGLGVFAFLLYFLFRGLLPVMWRIEGPMTRLSRRRWAVRAVLAIAVALCAAAEGPWRLARGFSPTALHVVATLGAVMLSLRFMRTGGTVSAIASMALWGALAVETPAGLVGGGALVTLTFIAVCRGNVSEEFANPVVWFAATRRMAAAFGGAFVLTALADVVFFVSSDGLEAQGWEFLELLARLAGGLVSNAAVLSPVGCLFFLVVVVAPALIVRTLVPKGVDEDQLLDYRTGIAVALVGVVGLSQLAGWRTLWFWTWFKVPPMVTSDFALVVLAFLSALTVLWTLCIVVTDVFFRDYARIAARRFGAAAEEPAGQRVLDSFHRMSPVARRVTAALLAALPLLSLPFRGQFGARAMNDVIDAAVRRTVAEAGDARVIVTDGALDAGVELAAAADGVPLRAISMMGRGSARERYLRLRVAADEEDRTLLTHGAAEALRTWVREKSARVRNLAVQLGFELWRHDRLPMPVCGAMAARPGDAMPPAVAAEGAAVGRDLAARVVALYRDGAPAACCDPRLAGAFIFVQWRLARMCQMRADAHDARRETEQAMAENARAKELDDLNAEYARIRRQVESVTQRGNSRLTPREGLRLGLERADFRLARVFAEQVLAADPVNAQANFAMGMAYFVEDQFSRAEVYLKRCLEQRPDEPATLNNLAVSQLRQGRLAEAETNAVRAVELLPDSPELRRTLEAIRRAAARRLEKSAPTPAPSPRPSGDSPERDKGILDSIFGI